NLKIIDHLLIGGEIKSFSKENSICRGQGTAHPKPTFSQHSLAQESEVRSNSEVKAQSRHFTFRLQFVTLQDGKYLPDRRKEYFDQLISTINSHGVKVEQISQRGKEEELVLKDQMLAGIQHSSDKMDCLLCSFCFRFIDSIELQIGRKLYLHSLGDPANKCHTGTSLQTLEDCYDTDSPDMEDDSHMKNHEDYGNCASSSSKGNISLPKGFIKSLVNGELELPFSNKFPLPSSIPCAEGCGEAYYCSISCAESDWELFHSLLCTGKRSEALSGAPLLKFIENANGKARMLLHVPNPCKISMVTDFCLATYSFFVFYNSLYLRRLTSTCHFLRWCDCIALPDDVDSSDEAYFRMQIIELAFTSLQLLKTAIFDEEYCEPNPKSNIYSDLVVASPVGDYFLYIDDLPHTEKVRMHFVISKKRLRKILDALGDDYSICCQGGRTAFFPLHSCMNHTCCPNAKAFKRE
ncbi:hypothetical protein CUMW_204900, partial [Citrus unshiu]